LPYKPGGPDPVPTRFAIPMIALSVFVMAYSGLMGPAGILLLYGLWLPLILIKGLAVATPSRGYGFAFAYLGLCSASVLWSDYIGTTLRAAFELGTMIVCIIIIVNTIPLSSYIRGLIIGIDMVLMASLASGNYGEDAFGGPPTLVGLFGSKNQLGYFSELGIYVTLVFCLTREYWIARLLYGAPSLVIAFVCLMKCHSASATASLIVTIAVLIMVYTIAPLSRRLRAGIMITTFVVLPVLIAIGFSLGLQNLVLAGFGKDATLTGRTYLWATGMGFGKHQPFLGVGYTAFWVQGRPIAERLWYEFFIGNRGGFHFHDTYVEIFVELGLAGLLTLAFWLIATLFNTLRAITLRGPSMPYTLPLGLSVMLLIRSFVEVDILGPFGIGIFLFMPILPTIKRLMATPVVKPDATAASPA
jgi:exopolysaccharide production protein ExoQ